MGCMIRFLAICVLTLLGNALGLIIAAALLGDFSVQPIGFVVSVLFFTCAEALLQPFILSVSLRYLPALSGGIALITTFVGLMLTSLFTDGITIKGVSTWILASLIIWLCSVLAGVVLPLFIFKKTLANRRD